MFIKRPITLATGAAAVLAFSGFVIPASVTHAAELVVKTPLIPYDIAATAPMAAPAAPQGDTALTAALATILRAGDLLDEARVDELLEHTRKTLLGYLQHVQQFGDGQSGHAVDEVQDTMMRAPEAVAFQDVVRVGREIAVGEEQQLDDGQVDAVIIGYRRADRVGAGAIAFRHHVSWTRKFMSAMLTYFGGIGNF